jgi:DNA-directed RNA polymerase specialized sigma24 family protein
MNPIEQPTPEQEGASGYVDPILFAEGIYESQDNYEQAIDSLASRINAGTAIRRGREPRKGIALVVAPNSAVASSINATPEQVNLLSAALTQLPKTYKIIIAYHHLDGHTDEEIASELEMSKIQVRHLYRKAIYRLRIIMKSVGVTDVPQPANKEFAKFLLEH